MTNPIFWLGFFAGASVASMGYVALMLYIANRSGAKVGE